MLKVCLHFKSLFIFLIILPMHLTEHFWTDRLCQACFSLNTVLFHSEGVQKFCTPSEWFPGEIPLHSEGVQKFCTPSEFFQWKIFRNGESGKSGKKPVENRKISSYG